MTFMYVTINDVGEITEITPIKNESPNTYEVEFSTVEGILTGRDDPNDFTIINKIISRKAIVIGKGDVFIKSSPLGDAASLCFDFKSTGNVHIYLTGEADISSLPDTLKAIVTDVDDPSSILDMFDIHVSDLKEGKFVTKTKHPYDVDYNIVMLNYISPITTTESIENDIGIVNASELVSSGNADIIIKYNKSTGVLSVKKVTTEDINGMILNIVDANDPFVPLEIVALKNQNIKKIVKYNIAKDMDDISIVLVDYDLTHSLEII